MKAPSTPHARTGLAAGLHVKETVLVLAATLVLPFLVHAIPAAGGVPWGARLLPMFVAPFVGVVLFRLHVGLLPALLAPAVSFFLIGMPAAPVAARLALDLTAFTLLAYALLRATPLRSLRWVAAPLAYLAAKVLVEPLALALPGVAAGDLAAAVWTAFPGVVLLLALNVLLVEAQRRRSA